MNQYTDEVILNSLDGRVAVCKDKDEATVAVNIKGIVKLKKAEAGKLSYTYHKTTPVAAEPAKAELNLALVDGWKADHIYRLWIELGERDSHTSEFQNALTRENKVISIEVKAASAADAATSLEKEVKKQGRDSKNAKVSVEKAESKLTFTAVDEFVTIKKCELHELTVGPWETLTGYDHFEVVLEGTITKGNSGFGSAKWIVRNLRVPTLAHTSWTAVEKDDRPIPGATYVQYSVRMTADRGELTGMGAVGQKLTSVTDHIFFVKNDPVTTKDFEDNVLAEIGATADQA